MNDKKKQSSVFHAGGVVCSPQNGFSEEMSASF